jgi:hypothetical protein
VVRKVFELHVKLAPYDLIICSVGMCCWWNHLKVRDTSRVQVYIRISNQEVMKFLKAILVVALVGIASLLLIGVFVPEIDDEIELQVNEPVIHVFAGMLNTAEFVNWVQDLESIERTGGILAMPGSTFDMRFKSAETSQDYKLEILELSPMSSVKVRMYNDVLDIRMTVNFEADALATDLLVYVQIKGNGLVARSMIPLMKSVIMDEIRHDLESFKRLQEE